MPMNSSPTRRTILRWLGVLANLLVCATILAAAGAAIWYINQTEPTAEQITATRKSAALVETVTVHRGDYSPQISVLGTVQPAQDIVLSPRVRGQVIEMSPKLVPGGMVRQGDLLLRIDPADFENALSIRKSELEQKEASLRIEEGRQSLAEKELALLEGTISSETNRALVLRQPQIASIRAEVNAAKAAVKQAELDLERTRVLAPFDAQVLSRSVNIGSQVTTGDELAQLVGVDEYWVLASVPVRHLRWIQFPKESKKGSTVRLRNTDSWPEGKQRIGYVARMIGSLDQQTRLARVLIVVPDPLGADSGEPSLILDTLIETDIEGIPIPGVFQLDRKLIRDGDTIWVMKDDALQIRSAKIAFRDARHAYVVEGLDDGDQVVVTTLATVAEGIGLKRLADASSSIDVVEAASQE